MYCLVIVSGCLAVEGGASLIVREGVVEAWWIERSDVTLCVCSVIGRLVGRGKERTEERGASERRV